MVTPARANSLLISFCNVEEDVPLLALLEFSGERTKVRWIDTETQPHPAGITGLCYWRDLVCAVCQGGYKDDSRFVLLDPDSDFKKVGEGLLPHDPHSVCSANDALYFTITSQDSIYKATPNRDYGSWTVSHHWTAPGSSGEQDENHLNGIGFVEGELHVSGFDEKQESGWDSATQGFIYNVDQDDYVMRNIYHPHSLVYDSRTIWTCESHQNKLISLDGSEYGFPSTYLRGLAMDSQYIYVGSSRRRQFSKSSSEDGRQGVQREYRGRCCVFRSANQAEGQPKEIVRFQEPRNEIYDILPLRK